MIEGLKPFFNSLLYPCARVLVKINLHPNAVTLAGCAVSFAACYCAASGKWVLAAAVVALGSCMDGLDGLLAKLTDRKTAFGAVLDSTCDRITEMAWFLGLLLYYLRYPICGSAGIYLSYAAVCGSILVSYVRARSEGAAVVCRGGILQRPERIIILVVSFLLGPRLMLAGLALISLLSYVTVIQRLSIVFSDDTKKRDWD